jgi:hypothetical protein
MPSPEIDLVALTYEEWEGALDAAAELDLVHGGLFRARGPSVLVFCSPDNAPDRWSYGFPDGSPDLPRALVGQVEVEDAARENEVVVRLTVSNWGAAREVKAAHERGEYGERFGEFVLDQEAALRGTPAERSWLRRQFERLRAHSAGRLLGGD